MPVRKFSFQNTDLDTPEGQNWKQFKEGSQTIYKSGLTITAPVGTPSNLHAVFCLYGPLVFYSLLVEVPNGSGWNAATYISLPFPNLQLAGSFYNTGSRGDAYLAILGTQLSTVAISTMPTRLYFQTNYTNASGATLNVAIQGWYFRD